MTTPKGQEEANVLRLSLYDRLVGYLAGYKNGRNVLIFSEAFKNDQVRPTFSLIDYTSELSQCDQTVVRTMVEESKASSHAV